MVYSFIIDTPASTPVLAPLITQLFISKGVIRYWNILYPDGNWAEAPIKIMKGGSPILPINTEGSMSGSGSTFTSEEWIFISEHPYQLQAYTWNTDTKNNHKLYINITIMPLWTLLPYSNQLMELMSREEVKIIL